MAKTTLYKWYAPQFDAYFFIAVEDTTKKSPDNWFNLSALKDKIRGVATEEAYQLLQDKKSNTVIVAVIDSGIDIRHDDLKDNIWVNAKEIAGNGKDDDGNGYIDDINGWNFIGGKDGKNVGADSYELTREYARLNAKYANVDATKLKGTQKAEYQYYQEIKTAFLERKAEIDENYQGFKNFKDAYMEAQSVLQKHLNTTAPLTEAQVKAIKSDKAEVNEAIATMKLAFGYGLDEKQLVEGVEYFEKAKNYGYNENFNPRNIVGDKENDINDKYYGNNDVIGPDATHGTHVAGIIGAVRSNNIGMKGVADNVKIMVVRAVPDGDERDKDVANAIRYAVDNGARIINMSFGKAYSPNKEWVDEAIKYAQSKNVLLVHAAGNDSKNVDTEKNFPHPRSKDGKVLVNNWLEIGASSWHSDNNKFVADFTNYGQKYVDVFAPGVDIYATTPNQSYEYLSGTSMAAPVTSGVAALLLSYFPELTAVQLKDILMKSSTKYKGTMVNKPGAENTVDFGTLSNTGGIVNAYEAVKMAIEMTKK
ncbi:MAG: peptidase S8 [Cytophagales bacterium]|nr:MAG: peptidase S8 [Cytophagales bacterium]